MNYFLDIFSARYILGSLVKRDLVSRYRRSFFGVAWTLLTPLGTVTVIGGVYSIIFNAPFHSFIPLLFAALMPWFFISQCAEGGTMSFIGAEGFITQTRTPIEIFPVRTAVGSLVNLLISMSAFFLVYAFINPLGINWNTLYIIPGFFILLIFGTALANITSLINVYIRDFAPLLSLIMQALFYITPVIYPIEIMKERGFESIYLYNPFYYLIEIIRQPALGGPPSLNTWTIAISISVLTFVISVIAVKKVGRKIVFKF